MTPRTQKIPSSSCIPPSSIGSSFAYHLLGSSTPFLRRSTWPLPSYIPTAGHSLGHFLFSTFGHTPSVNVFLHFFEAKSLGKKLWMSVNGFVGRVLLSLFQQSYKGFKGKFFKIRCSKFDPPCWTSSLFIG